MVRYLVKNKLTGATCNFFDTPGEAGKWVEEYTREQNEGLDPNDEGYCSPFDFSLEMVEVTRKDIDNKEDASAFARWQGECCLTMYGLTRSRARAIRALDRLLTIAQQWNKEDGFVPDFSSKGQLRYFPLFEYDKGEEVYKCVSAGLSRRGYAYLGALLCFATSDRAIAFGRQFRSEFNDFLINNN